MKHAADRPTVFVIIPTFNRWAHTHGCLGFLASQTWSPISVVVSDGGSTDGTRERLASQHPEITLLFDKRERWWAGSTSLGIAHALCVGQDQDYILLLNNDTEFPADYIATLVAASQRENATVGAKIVDSRNPSVVLDAGEYINWTDYTFPVRTDVPRGERFRDDVDVLPGRGSLIPLATIRSVGNVDDVAFPHYLADYDLFCRIKAAGHRMGVCLETAIRAHIEETGIQPGVGRTSFRQIGRELFSRRSMTNIRDHWRFVDRHAPAGVRARAKRLILRRALHRALFGTSLAPLCARLLQGYVGVRTAAAIARRLWIDRHEPDGRFHALGLPKPLAQLAVLAILPRPVSEDEFAAMGLDPAELERAGVIAAAASPGWYYLLTLDTARAAMPRAVAAIAETSIPLSRDKIARLQLYRRSKAFSPGSRDPNPPQTQDR